MLADLQEAVAALVTDQSLRRRFERSPAEALDRWWPQLAAEERTMLAALAPAALRRCAEGLLDKRWDDLRRVAPLAARVAPSLRQHHRRWLGAHPARAIDTVLGPGEAEGLRALPALAARLRADEAAPPYSAELLVYEVLAGCSALDGEVRFARTEYPVHAIAAELRQGRLPSLEPERAPHRYRFTRAAVRYQPEQP